MADTKDSKLKDYHIVNSNFRDRYEEIKSRLKCAAVISIDSEFSGLSIYSQKNKNTLFDNGAERYLRLKENLKDFIIIQFGLTAFCFNRDDNKYEAHMYNFFIFPRSFVTFEQKFACLSSSLEFLSRNSFDFNKVIYEGIPYLSEQQQEELTKNLQNADFESNLSADQNEVLSKSFIEITNWSRSAKLGEEMCLKNYDLDSNHGIILTYLLHRDVRNRFSNLWSTSTSKEFIVTKVEEEKKELLQKENAGLLEENLVDYYLGFTKIFNLLVSLKKPFVGHNVLLDLMIMHNQFYRPLPDNYKEFKKNIATMFPKLFDTKLISYELKKLLKRDAAVLGFHINGFQRVPSLSKQYKRHPLSDFVKGMYDGSKDSLRVYNSNNAWVSNALMELYKFFLDGKGRDATLYRPDVKLSILNAENVVPDVILHEAGWDAYLCGYCFVQMGHYFASANYGPDGYKRPLVSTEHVNGVAKFTHKVNVVRASVPYMDFSGQDPPTNRPPVLLVQYRGRGKINLNEVANMLGQYCSVDVKKYNSSTALVAVSSFPGARNMLSSYKSSEKYKIKIHRPLKDSDELKIFVISMFVLSTGLTVAGLYLRCLGK